MKLTREELCVKAFEGIPDSVLESEGCSFKAELDTLDFQIERALKAENKIKEISIKLGEIITTLSKVIKD